MIAEERVGLGRVLACQLMLACEFMPACEVMEKQINNKGVLAEFGR